MSGAGAGCVEQACVVPGHTVLWGGACGWPQVWWYQISLYMGCPHISAGALYQSLVLHTPAFI